MGSVQLRSGRLVVVFSDGTSRDSGVTVSAQMSEQEIGTAIARARSNVSAYYFGRGDETHATEANRASGDASAMYRSFHPTRDDTEAPAQPAAPAAPAPTAPREEAPAPRRSTPRRSRPPAEATPPAEERPAAPREERRSTREATPRPTISGTWIEQQLRDATRGDRQATAAAGLVHSNSRYVDRFLGPEAQRGIDRSEGQRNATIAVFNALYAIPSFRLYLSSVAATQQTVFPEFVRLQEFITDPGRTEQLSAEASAEILRAADTYIRYFLFNFVAGNPDYSRYREELAQLPVGNWRLGNVESARTFQPGSGRAISEADRMALMKLYLTSPMDADTLTASVLYIRRWSLEHPERGRGRAQSRIDVWRAPEILVPTEEAAPQVAQPAATAAPTVATPNMVIIGDSLVASGRIGTTLQRTLREQFPQATVASRGVVGESIAQIRNRFRRDVLEGGYNTVVIEGGINGITGLTVEQAEGHFSWMIGQARARGMRVVLIGLTPWAGYSGSSDDAQQRTTTLNTWLRAQATTDGNVVFVDVSQLGEGTPPRLRSEYERSTGPDHLHPGEAGLDLIASQIARIAYPRQQSATEARSELQDFADRNWRNLSTELYQQARQGNPAGTITVSRNLPPGQSSLESALRAASRDDIPRAFDRIFNDYLHRDSDFLEFCRANREYQSVAVESVRLGTSSSAADRRLVVRAMQAFLNERAGRTGQEWYGRLRDDLRMLYRDVLSLGRDDLHVDGIEDVRTLAAIGVYSWRKANQSEAVGNWASTLGIRPPSATVPAQPAQPPAEDRGGRRRTIHPELITQ